MRRLVLGTVFLLLVALRAEVAQQPQKSEAKYGVKKCKPKVVSNKPIAKPKTIHMGKGEKATGYSPVIAFSILESGDVVNAHVKRSSGIADVDAYALNSIQGTKYNNRPGCGTLETEADVLIHFD
jgi:TonB family protein